MDTVTIALGSNVGDRHRHLREAFKFLSEISEKDVRISPMYLTEPVGLSGRYFLNAAIEIATELTPKNLLDKLKKFERTHGRRPHQPRWSARTIDLDIICFGDLVIQEDTLIIPHPEYHQRLFVLEPLQDIRPNWHDPQSGVSIKELINNAPKIGIKQTALTW